MSTVPDWLDAVFILYAYAFGTCFGMAISKPDDPFWRGFLDGLTLRFIWGRWL